jgi:hypothetical protein
MKTFRYGAHTIKSFPSLRMDCRRWKIGITIFCERDGMITMRGFQPESSYLTEEHADLHGIEYARQIIDGNVPGLSVI